MKAELKLEDGRILNVEIDEKWLKQEAEWPRVTDKYFYMTSCGVVHSDAWRSSDAGKKAMSLGNCFKTKQEAENAIRALRLIKKIADARRQANGDWRPDWLNCEENKHLIIHERKSVVVDIWVSCVANVFGYFRHQNDVKAVIEQNRTELEWYFTEYLPSIN